MLQIPFLAAHCQVPEYAAEHGLSEEEAGRILRYQILEEQAAAWEQELSAGKQEAPVETRRSQQGARTIRRRVRTMQENVWLIRQRVRAMQENTG